MIIALLFYCVLHHRSIAGCVTTAGESEIGCFGGEWVFFGPHVHPVGDVAMAFTSLRYDVRCSEGRFE